VGDGEGEPEGGQETNYGHSDDQVLTENIQGENGSSADDLINADDQSALHIGFMPRLRHILRSDASDDNWLDFENLMQEATQCAAEMVKLPEISTGTTTGKRRADIEDAPYIQKLYRRNRRQAVRLITQGNSEPCAIPTTQLQDHFTETWARRDWDTSMYANVSPPTPRHNLESNRFNPEEVCVKLRKAENTAPGDDRLTYRHWRSVDPACTFLAAVFNICLKYCRIPQAWKHSKVVLIHKKGDREDPSNWRPISLGRTIYKLYAGCWAARIQKWIEANNVLSICQKGFLPHDGVMETHYVFENRLSRARSERAELAAAFLDCSNAFGCVPHEALTDIIQREGMGDVFTSIVRDMYKDNTAQILTASGTTDQITVGAGVRQGCPLSGLLFILAIDPALRELQRDEAEHKVLAYADDLTPLANNAAELQRSIETISNSLARLNLRFNPAKCKSLHFNGHERPIGCRPTPFTINGQPMEHLKDGEHMQFLGKPVGYNLLTNWATLDDISNHFKALMSSKLAPWQRLDALRTFFYPSLHFALRTTQFAKKEWIALDNAIRAEMKRTLNLPDRASNDYIYGSRSGGGCNIPVLADDSDVLTIDGAFKLLTSRDPIVQELALDSLLQATKDKLKRNEVTTEDAALFLSRDMSDAFKYSSNHHRNQWTKTRIASGHLGCEWQFENNVPRISRNNVVLHPSHRLKVCSTLRGQLQEARDHHLQSCPNQGKAMTCAANHKASSHFMNSGSYTRFADWRFIHRARLNLVPLRAARPWSRQDNQMCRRCNSRPETLPHVINHCMIHAAAIQNRHNEIVTRIRKAAEYKMTVVGDNQAVVPNSNLRPDLILKHNQTAYIVDVTVPFDNKPEAFTEAREEKIRKYDELRHRLRGTYADVQIQPIVVGALGSWDPANDPFLRKLCSRNYARMLRQLCVSSTIRWSRDIYIEHLTGKRQY